MSKQVEITRSNGFSKNGGQYYYLRPSVKCDNKSRRVLEDRIVANINKWFSPDILLYKINGSIIGSNSEENALKEYWRICDEADIKKQFPVELLNPQP